MTLEIRRASTMTILAMLGVSAMFIKITTDSVQGQPKGTIMEVADAVGRAYTEADQAVESNAGEHLMGLLRSQMAERDTAINKQFDELKAERRGVPVRAPGGDPSLNLDAATVGTSASADRDARGRSDAKAKNIGDITRCLYLQRSDDGSARQYATQRLEKSYGLQRSTWTDPNAGYTPAEGQDFGVQRAGTESMTGAATYGYLVPPEFIKDVFRIMSEESVVTGTKQVPIGSSVETKYPALDQFGTGTGAKKSNYHAGVQLYRATETMQRTASDAALNEIEFKITDLTGFTKVSRDAMADANYPLDTLLNDLFSQAFVWRKDYDFLWGTGVGEPLGIFNSNALIGGGGVSGNAGRTTSSQILFADLVWMLSKLHPNCWGGAYFVASLTTLPWLIGIQSASGTFVFQPNSLVAQGDRPSVYGPGRFQGTLMGFPVRFTEKAAALGSAGDLSLICPSQYGECTRAGLEVGTSTDFLFDTDQVAIRWKLRNDAKPLWRSKFTGQDTSTSSPFVRLV